MKILRRQLAPAVVMLAALTLVLGLLYPLAVTGVAQATMPGRADGSLVRVDGNVVGSTLVGQGFVGEEYFHPRPSAAGDGYDALASAGSNLGPGSQELIDTVDQRVDEYRTVNRLDEDIVVPVDAVTASGSGLDPHISVANATLQAQRVADARGTSREEVMTLIEIHTDHRSLGFLGQAGVNVFGLNLALDESAR